MLALEICAEVLAFLRLYDLVPMLTASRSCSLLAQSCMQNIRHWSYPGLYFCVISSWIYMFNCDTAMSFDLHFESANELADFVRTAFRNCVFDYLSMNYHQISSHAIEDVADGIIITKSLELSVEGLDCSRHIIDFIGRFRRIQV